VIVPNTPSLTQSTLTATVSEMTLGNSGVVTLTLYDDYGNANPLPAPTVSDIEFVSASANGGSVTYGSITQTGSNVFTAPFTGTNIGNVAIGAKINQATISPTSSLLITRNLFSQTWDFGHQYATTRSSTSLGVVNQALSLIEAQPTPFTAGLSSSPVNSMVGVGSQVSFNAVDTYEKTLASSWTPAYSDLLAYFKLDESSSVIIDEISALSGSVSGAQTYTQTGALGSGYGIMLANSPNSVGFQFSSATFPGGNFSRSIMLWANPAALPTTTSCFHLAGAGNSTPFGLALCKVGGTQYIRTDINATEGTAGSCDYAKTLPTGSFTHLASTYDGSTIKLYINGVFANQCFKTLTTTHTATSGRIGNNFAANRAFAGGTLDDVSFWKSSLNANAVWQIYQHQSTAHNLAIKSAIMDSYSSSPWTHLQIKTDLPYGKSIPLTNETVSDYPGLVNSAGSSGDSQLNSGLAALWSMEQMTASGSGSVTDTKSSYSATPVGTVTFGKPGIIGKAVEFDGSTGYLTASSSINLGSNWTRATWVRLKSLGKQHSLIEKYDNSGTAGSFALRISSANKLQGMLWYGTTSLTCSDTASLTTYKWTHVAAVYDSTSKMLKCYVNGVMVNSVTNSGNLPTASSSQTLKLGTTGNGHVAANALNGYLDEPAIWSRSLHNKEILQLYLRGASRVYTQVRTCTTATCSDDPSGLNWKGPDNTNQTFFSEQFNTLGFDATNILGTGGANAGFFNILFSGFFGSSINTRYFQYRMVMESDDASDNKCGLGASSYCAPVLKQVSISPVHYDAASPNAVTLSNVSVSSLNAISQTLGPQGCPGGVTYNFGRLNSTTGTIQYYYFDSSVGNNVWRENNGTTSQSNSLSNLTANNALSIFSSQFGTSTINLKAFLNSNGSQPCELSSVTVTGSSGKTSLDPTPDAVILVDINQNTDTSVNLANPNVTPNFYQYYADLIQTQSGPPSAFFMDQGQTGGLSDYNMGNNLYGSSLTNGVSFNIWMYLPSGYTNNDTGYYIMNLQGSQTYIDLFVNYDTLYLVSQRNGYFRIDFEPSYTQSKVLDQWVNIGCTITANGIEVYRNGENITSLGTKSGSGFTPPETYNFLFSSFLYQGGSDGFYTPGPIQYSRMSAYKRALSDAEFKYEFDSQRSRFGL
jgi:hypothetical protein